MARTVIRADQSWLHVNWREIWAYRDLLRVLVVRDFTAIYKQSVLGPVWYVLQPLGLTLLFTVVFGQVAHIDTNGVPPFLFYMSGMLFWQYFQGCMNGISSSLIDNAALLGKVYFPRLIMPLSIIITNLAQFLLNLVIFVILLIHYRINTPAPISTSLDVLWLPVLALQCAAVGLGVGLWMSALTTRYRDLRFAQAFIVQVWLFATPVVYPAKLIPGKWQTLAAVNPMSGIIELSRHAFLGTPPVPTSLLLVSAVASLVLVTTGMLLFNRVQRTFVDTI